MNAAPRRVIENREAPRKVKPPAMTSFIDMVSRICDGQRVTDDEILMCYEDLGDRRPAACVWLAAKAIDRLMPDDVSAVRTLVQMGKEAGDEDLDEAIAQTVEGAADVFATVALRVFGHRYLAISADAFGSMLMATLGPGLTRIRVLRPVSTMICAHPYCDAAAHQVVLAGLSQTYLFSNERI